MSARGAALALLLVPLAACSAAGRSKENGPEILELTQGTFTGGDFPLQVERRDEPRVLALRKQEKLDQVVEGAVGQLQLFARLVVWARSQFEPGVPEPYPLSNGLSILADVRAGRTGGFCGQYSYLLGDALKSFGHFAVRYVELENESGAGHFAVEAWNDELNRWILLDPLNAALYERDGVPLSAVEIHDALIGGRIDTIRVRRLRGSSPGPRPAAGAGAPSDSDLIAFFYNVAVSTRNDFARLEAPLTMTEREGIFLRYADPRVAPFRHLDFELASVRREDFLVPMDQVAIEILGDDRNGQLHISLSTRGTCPHFVSYRIRIADGPWRNSGPLLGWNLAPGENSLEVRTVNAFEVLGAVFRIRVRN